MKGNRDASGAGLDGLFVKHFLIETARRIYLPRCCLDFLLLLAVLALFGNSLQAKPAFMHWQTTIDVSGKGAQIGVLEGDEQEYGSIFYASCRPLVVRVQFNDATNAKIVGGDVYPLMVFIADGKRINVGFDTLKWSDVPGGWQAQADLNRNVLASISKAASLSVEVVDNAHDQKVLGRLDYPKNNLSQSFVAFMKACF